VESTFPLPGQNACRYRKIATRIIKLTEYIQRCENVKFHTVFYDSWPVTFVTKELYLLCI
jgi:hypothetical protein